MRPQRQRPQARQAPAPSVARDNRQAAPSQAPLGRSQAIHWRPADLLQMQRHLGNRAVQRLLGIRPPAGQPARLQRQLLYGDDTEPQKVSHNTNWWKGLSSLQQSKANRIEKDLYNHYTFDDKNHFQDYIDGTSTQKPKVQGYYHRQGIVKGNKYKKQDQFYTIYNRAGTGGIEPGKTKSHQSNFAYFVDIQYEAVERELNSQSKKPNQTISDLYKEALQSADSMDQTTQKSGEDWSTVMDRDELYDSSTIRWNINAMWKEVAKLLSTSRQSYPQINIPRWKGLNNSMGAGVSMTYTWGQSLPAGSAASGTSIKTGWDDLKQRAEFSGDTLYVYGHLLNDHIGGPAAPYNLVPLTNSANGTHEKNVEKYVKESIAQMQRDEQASSGSPIRNPLKQVVYTVDTVWGDHGRGAKTKQWEKAADDFSSILMLLNKHTLLSGTYTKKVEDLVDGLRDGSIEGRATNKLVIPLSGGIKKTGKHIPKKPKVQLINIQWNGQDLTYTNIWTNQLKDFVDTVVPGGKRSSTTLKKALELVENNAALWKSEDALVPTHLDCTLTLVRDQDQESIPQDPVKNELHKLPLNQPYKEG